MNNPRIRPTLSVLLGLLFALLHPALHAASEGATKAFEIFAGPADVTLRQFATQSGLEVLYSADAVEGVMTNAVKGELAPLDALDQLLKGTVLANAKSAKSGVLQITRVSDPNALRAAHTASNRPDETSPSVGNEAAPATALPSAAEVAKNPSSSGSDETIELTPFVVAADSDRGWVATETLAGTRLRTDLRDVPNQIEMLTKDFMNDLGLTSLDEALIYTANAENNSEYLPATPGSQISDPTRGGRLRGIGNATGSRHFFQTSLRNDNYNTESVAIASGPNAVLFGLGNPAGTTDSTLARANLLRNKYSFSQQFDSENSKRTEWDANWVFIPKVLAVRFMGLAQERFTHKKPNLDRDDRVYGAITFKPTPSTTIVMRGERVNATLDAAPRVLPLDFVYSWLHADTIAGSIYSAPKPIFNNNVTWNNNTVANNVIFNRHAEGPVFVESGGVFDAIPVRSWRNSVVGSNPATLPGVPAFDSTVDVSLLDESVFPFDVNVAGLSRRVLNGGFQRMITLEQKITDDLFFEAAYNSEDSYNIQNTAGSRAGSNSFRLNVDANQFIPGTSTPNPFAGQYYFEGSAGISPSYVNRRDWRMTLSYNLDLAKKFDQGWGKWLGRHAFSAIYGHNYRESVNQLNIDRRIIGNPVIAGLTLTPKTTANWAFNATRVPQYRHYFTNSPYDPNMPFGPFNGTWTALDSNGNPFELALIDTGMFDADGRRLAAQNPVTGNRLKLDSKVLVWQGRFLQDSSNRDRLILTYGYRQDHGRTSDPDTATRTRDFSGLYPLIWDATYEPYKDAKRKTNRNYGVVVRPLQWLSLKYNQSTTGDLSTGTFDPFGNLIPGTEGESKEYGFRIDLFDSKLQLNVNHFKTVAGPQRASNEIQGFKGNFQNIEDRIRELDPNLPTINITDGTLHGYPVDGNQSYNITSNNSNTGTEINLDYQPTKNWSIRVNGSVNTPVESEIGKAWFDWVAQRLPVWQSVVAKNGEVDSSGKPVTWSTAELSPLTPSGLTLEQYYNNQIVTRALGFMTAADGRATDSARAGKLNFVTSYRFQGALKGFRLTGALRMRDNTIIGYGTKLDSLGNTVYDLDNVYYGPKEVYLDAIMAYKGKMKAFGGFNYNVQLTVRNVLDKNDALPSLTFSDGSVAKLATIEPRVISVKFDVEF